MLKKTKNIDAYLNQIKDIEESELYSCPSLFNVSNIKEKLDKYIADKSNVTYISLDENNNFTGLYIFYIIKEERYGELIVGLSKNKDSYDELFGYLVTNYKDYKIDFVYNPKNNLFNEFLEIYHAKFDTIQQEMHLKDFKKRRIENKIVLYSNKYKKEYLKIHSKDVYWTGEKILKAQDRFRTILGIGNNEVVGYIDISYGLQKNVVFDVFVKEEYRNMGFAKDMLAFAVELDDSKYIFLEVDIDNVPAIKVYERLGFTKTGKDLVAVHLNIN